MNSAMVWNILFKQILSYLVLSVDGIPITTMICSLLAPTFLKTHIISILLRNGMTWSESLSAFIKIQPKNRSEIFFRWYPCRIPAMSGPTRFLGAASWVQARRRGEGMCRIMHGLVGSWWVHFRKTTIIPPYLGWWSKLSFYWGFESTETANHL